ncbi:MAG: ABC transporter ATP-binding protein [Bifidobacterium sp.]|jgi:ABC-2 type transport system ATP-binding protein|nr:ABC transporter ATP-binding protein [Bifidobacterium sp.]
MQLDAYTITKAYGGHHVLTGASMHVPPGRIVGLMGVNGAGKTTLISILAGLTAPDSGNVHIAGIDALAHRREAASHIGLAPQALGIYPTLSVLENLRCFAGLAGLRGRTARRRIHDAAAAMGLSDRLGQTAQNLSGGQQRRLHTAMAILNRPDVLFLDEPTVGSDVQSRTAILDVVSGMAREGTSVVYTTHYPPELEHLDADIMVLADGRITEYGNVRSVIDQWSRPMVTLRFRGKAPTLLGWERQGQTMLACADCPQGSGPVLAAALSELSRERRISSLADVQVAQPSLEAAYLAITRTPSHHVRGADDVAVA